MSEIPELINDLAYILMSAGIVTLIFKRLKQPLVLGYIVAGFLVSPHMPYTASVVDTANVHLWADIGVMFLLFSLGLDHHHHLLHVDAGCHSGSCLRLVEDGLYLPRRYAGHVINDDYL